MAAAPAPIVVSMGDPAGIGPDIIINAWLDPALKLPEMVVLGSSATLEERAEAMGKRVSFSNGSNAGLRVIELENKPRGLPGSPDAFDAAATLEAIDRGVEMVVKGEASAVVTCPINKKALYDTGFTHPGHTEYLAELATRHFGSSFHPVMMIAGPELRTVPVTIHIPVSEVPEMLSTPLIVETVLTTAQDMQSRFGIPSPRIAIAGLNPHAGENGSIGLEDERIVRPAVEELRNRGIHATGPLPADTLFHQAARSAYDVAVCMYHDQALIPAKMLGFDDGVNVTLGLPFIRTSPDHGTAYDIAGTGKANPSSFVAALRMAAEMAARS
ncbi:MAG: 4-hydroxythreonine-4-phosphate dehydrogenase PdxA [Pseudomonadota bacterium]